MLDGLIQLDVWEIFGHFRAGRYIMRVIAGSARGCKLLAPKGLGTRPTADRMKEDLFNILAPYLPDASFLDLYSGSGAIGIEALSRGARDAVFVDSSPEAISAIEANLRKTRLAEHAEILHMNALVALRQFGDENFSIIFLDPPYGNEKELKSTLNFLAQGNLLANDGIIIVEWEAGTDSTSLENKFPGLQIYRKKVYTRTQFGFYKVDDDKI